MIKPKGTCSAQYFLRGTIKINIGGIKHIDTCINTMFSNARKLSSTQSTHEA